jgi:predicted tellurium resistance membrane protein TerC
MDLAFSIDNVFAAVAFTDNIYLIWIGVFIGFWQCDLCSSFVRLMERYPFLETSAFVVIGVLGVKLALSAVCHLYPDNAFCHFMEGETADSYISILTVAIFAIPIITSSLFNFPKHDKS